MKHGELTHEIIGAAYRVHGELGCGFLEKVYEYAMALELNESGHKVKQQEPIEVTYRGRPVGDYFSDLVVDDTVIVEVKAVKAVDPKHEVQLVNYLKATGLEIGLLINFGRSVEVQRKILDDRQ